VRTTLPLPTRLRVLERDGRCCVHCGVNVVDVAEAFTLVQAMHERKPWSYPTRQEFAKACGYGDGSHTWETNHVVAVVEGGANDDDNLETVCIPCHRVHTNGVVARRAKARRVAQKFGVNDEGKQRTRRRPGPKARTGRKWPTRKVRGVWSKKRNVRTRVRKANYPYGIGL
jgi:5-methylcytosine-specific restriction endonuclease McrA